MKKCSYFMGFLMIISISSCGQKTFDEKMNDLYKHTVPLIKSGQLKTQLSDVVLLDARSEEEYQISHLPSARMLVYDEFDISQINDVPKDAPIVVYCSVGYRSERIGEKLKDAGYANVKNLYGGIFDWKNQGYEVVGPNNLATDSVHTYNKSWSKWLYKGIKIYE